MLRSSLFFILFVAWSCSNARVYKWTDEQGNVHFGDRPPTEEAEEIKIPKQPPPPTAAKERNSIRQRMLEMYQEDRNKKKLEKAKQKQEAKQRAKKCESARHELSMYKNSNALYDKLPGGERRYLTEEEREKAITELQEAIEKHCQ